MINASLPEPAQLSLQGTEAAACAMLWALWNMGMNYHYWVSAGCDENVHK